MFELSYRVRYAYPAAAVFAALTDVADYPRWQEDVLAAWVPGGGPVRLGTEISQMRNVLGRSIPVRLVVEAYEPDRAMTLRTVAGTRSQFSHAFLLEPAASGGCHLEFLATLDGVPPMVSSFAEAILTYQAIQLSDGVRAHLATQRRT